MSERKIRKLSGRKAQMMKGPIYYDLFVITKQFDQNAIVLCPQLYYKWELSAELICRLRSSFKQVIIIDFL